VERGVKLEDRVLAWLAQQNSDIYVVGGAVRDRLLGRPVYDLDLAMAGDGLVLARRLADRFQGAYYPLDETRNTGRAILRSEEGRRLVVDVAQFRGPDPAGLGPAERCLAIDLDDRDFTINALAADVRALDDIIDRHGGLHDLEAGIIRPVSEESIADDPLRALRAIRLAAGLGFALAEETVTLIRRDGAALAQVSGERVRDELARLLAHPSAAGYLVQMDSLGLLTVLFPELETLRDIAQPPPHRLDVLAHSLETVRNLELVLSALGGRGEEGRNDVGRQADGMRRNVHGAWLERHPRSAVSSLHLEELAPFAERLQAHVSQRLGDARSRFVTLKLAALLHDSGKPETRSEDEAGRIRFVAHEARSVSIAAGALRRLRFNNTETRLVSVIIRHHCRPLQLASQDRVSSRAIYRFFRDTGRASVDVLLHALADHLAKGSVVAGDGLWSSQVSLTGRMLADYYDRPHERIDPPTLLDGNDLIGSFGLEPGPQIGHLLELVREGQVSGQIGTREDALAFVRARLSELGGKQASP
jgi:poly(A) polymerase/tRNA nucleotidyltransferase (CCA-adding enzyme)